MFEVRDVFAAVGIATVFFAGLRGLLWCLGAFGDFQEYRVSRARRGSVAPASTGFDGGSRD